MTREGPETKLVNRMRKAAQEKYGDRLVVIKHHGSQFSEAGVSDLIGTLDGVFFACEVKAPESYGNSIERALQDGPTLKQRAFVQRVNRAGGIGGFAASVSGFLDLLEHAEMTAEGWRYGPS